MKTKVTKQVGNQYEWSLSICGYDSFECTDTLVSYLNLAGCNAYFNKNGEVILCCAEKNISKYMLKAEELYYEHNLAINDEEIMAL